MGQLQLLRYGQTTRGREGQKGSEGNSIANLSIFQTSNNFLPTAPSNKCSYLKKNICQLLFSDSNDKKAHIFHLNYSEETKDA